MAMKRCNNGHFYDSSKHSVCPFCGVQNLDMSVTMPVRNPVAGPVGAPPPNATLGANPIPGMGAAAPGATLGANPADPALQPNIPAAVEKTVAKGNGSPDNQKTVGILRKAVGFEPVVGWLVCIEGPDAGRDFRLKSERNFIGRGANMDVAIQSDGSISRDAHAVISYDPRNNRFKIYPGESHGLAYLNGEEVYTPMPLQARDVIELGQTKLVFIPFCGEEFVWQGK